MTKRKNEGNKDVGHTSENLEDKTDNGAGSGNDRTVQIDEDLAEQIEKLIREHPELGYETIEEVLRDSVRREIRREEQLDKAKTTLPLDKKRVLVPLPKVDDIPVKYLDGRLIVVGQCDTQAKMDKCEQKTNEYAEGGEIGRWDITERTGKRRNKLDELVLKAIMGDKEPKVEPYVLFLNPSPMLWKTMEALRFFEGVGFGELAFYAIEKEE